MPHGCGTPAGRQWKNGNAHCEIAEGAVKPLAARSGWVAFRHFVYFCGKVVILGIYHAVHADGQRVCPSTPTPSRERPCSAASSYMPLPP
ncbi:hypothetical protein DLM_1016 [Aquitalea magnusonii]|uniref:Uncharacterized protein n=1 Tax=Aquitalea magnusonii TaxID=332411 RepID=A0A3G9GGK1_9NEIS|nr:hypothetical protein DLM_1016 [Aquitalea magnusonii]